MVKHSISRRLAAMFAVVALFVFTMVGTGLFLVLRTQLENHLRESLDTRAEIARLIVLHASTPDKWKMAKEKLADITPRDGSTLFAASSDDSRFTYGTPLAGSIEKRVPGGYVRLRPNGRAYDMLMTAVTIPANGERPPLQLQVAIDCSPNVRTMRVFGFALAALTALGTITVLLLSYSVAKIGLAPLTRLTKDASNVSPNNRSQRLSTRSLPYELEDLAKSFNGALERLDSAYARLESFNADVAHELRTPVTILIGQTEVALTRDRSIDELRHTLQSNLEEFERVRAIINDMLFLARADQGERATGLVEVSLAAEVARTLEFLEIPLEEAQVRAVSTGDARAFVNTSLFGRALINLVMNAIQHCAPRRDDIGIDRARTRAHQHRGGQSRRTDPACDARPSVRPFLSRGEFAHQQPRESRARARDREGGRGNASRNGVGEQRSGRQHVRVFGGALRQRTKDGRAAEFSCTGCDDRWRHASTIGRLGLTRRETRPPMCP